LNSDNEQRNFVGYIIGTFGSAFEIVGCCFSGNDQATTPVLVTQGVVSASNNFGSSASDTVTECSFLSFINKDRAVALHRYAQTLPADNNFAGYVCSDYDASACSAEHGPVHEGWQSGSDDELFFVDARPNADDDLLILNDDEILEFQTDPPMAPSSIATSLRVSTAPTLSIIAFCAVSLIWQSI
jgi:hypothetical protein